MVLSSEEQGRIIGREIDIKSPSKSPLKGDLEGDRCPPHLTQIGSRNSNLSLCHIDAGKDCEESKY
jgi:hypothetical protein